MPKAGRWLKKSTVGSQGRKVESGNSLAEFHALWKPDLEGMRGRQRPPALDSLINRLW